MAKTFYTGYRVGSRTGRYTVSFYDGVKTHEDGSQFFDLEMFSNKKDFTQFLKDLEKEGYIKYN